HAIGLSVGVSVGLVVEHVRLVCRFIGTRREREDEEDTMHGAALSNCRTTRASSRAGRSRHAGGGMARARRNHAKESAMRVRDVMTIDPACCTPETSIETVANLMVDRDCGAIPVIGDLATRRPLGIVTDRDIVTRLIATGRDPTSMIAADCMTT